MFFFPPFNNADPNTSLCFISEFSMAHNPAKKPNASMIYLAEIKDIQLQRT